MQASDNKDPCLKSQRCENICYVTFVSLTGRNVDVFWLDYNGRRVKYGSVDSLKNNFYDVTTFETHPWIFRDSTTGDKLVVCGGKEVYLPSVSNNEERTYVPIGIPVYTLKERSLQIIRMLYSEEEINSFLIPETLKHDVKNKENIPHKTYSQPLI